MLESIAGVSLFVVVLACLAEWLVLFADVVLVSVVLDDVRGFVPSPTLITVAGVRPEGGEVGGWVVAVPGHELFDLCVDFGSDPVQSHEFFAVLARVLDVRGLLAAGDAEGLVGVVELAVQVLDRMFDAESFGSSFASVSDGLAAAERVEPKLLAPERVGELVAPDLKRADVGGRIQWFHPGDAFEVVAFVAELVQVGVEHPASQAFDVDPAVDSEFLGVTDPQRRAERVERRPDRFGGVLLVFAFALFHEIDPVVFTAA